MAHHVVHIIDTPQLVAEADRLGISGETNLDRKADLNTLVEEMMAFCEGAASGIVLVAATSGPLNLFPDQ